VNAESEAYNISLCRVAAGKDSRIHHLVHTTGLGVNADGTLISPLLIVVKDEVAFVKTV
jgi:hypothetical protein